MSLSARNWAWDITEITVDGVRRRVHPGEKLTLLSIAEHENCEEGIAFPSQERIAERTSQSVRTVHTHIEMWKAIGALEVDRRKSRAGRWLRNVYVVHVPPEYRDRDPEWLRWQG